MPSTEPSLTEPSSSALPAPLKFKTIMGPFSVIVVAGEKCLFRRHCKRENCVVKFGKWPVKSWPFDCGLFYQSGDYLNLGSI